MVRRPLPPNRTCGSPASGSPVDGSPARGLADKTEAECKPKSLCLAKMALGVSSLTPGSGPSAAALAKCAVRPTTIPGAATKASWVDPARVALTARVVAIASPSSCTPWLPRRYPASSLLRVLRLLLALRTCSRAGLPASCNRPSEPSVSNHRPAPMAALAPNPSAPSASLAYATVWASPLGRRLARRYGRIEFLIVRMARSPLVALHPASRRRSYIRLQAGVGHTWGRLAPPCSVALAGARSRPAPGRRGKNCRFPFQSGFFHKLSAPSGCI